MFNNPGDTRRSSYGSVGVPKALLSISGLRFELQQLKLAIAFIFGLLHLGPAGLDQGLGQIQSVDINITKFERVGCARGFDGVFDAEADLFAYTKLCKRDRSREGVNVPQSRSAGARAMMLLDVASPCAGRRDFRKPRARLVGLEKHCPYGVKSNTVGRGCGSWGQGHLQSHGF